MDGHRNRWKTKNVLKKTFKKESKLDDTQANIKEGEIQTKRPSIAKCAPSVLKLLLLFNTSLHITFKTIRMVYLHFDFQIERARDNFLVKLCFHIVCNLQFD